MNGIINDINTAITVAYGDLDNPNYEFVKKQYDAIMLSPVVRELLQSFFVKDETNIAIDVALHLNIKTVNGGIRVLLSFVGKFLMIFRLDETGVTSIKTLDWNTDDISGDEWNVLKILDAHHYRLVSKDVALSPITINLCETDRGDITIYHAIFSDLGAPLTL